MGYAIFSLIDFFSIYNQIKLDKKSRDLTTFMTSLGLMRMIILPQAVTYLVVQFVKILLKILAPYLHDQVKLFLDNIEVRKLKTKYNNEELAPEIKHYLFKHIQNLDTVLADLEKARIRIAEIKSQFC